MQRPPQRDVQHDVNRRVKLQQLEIQNDLERRYAAEQLDVMKNREIGQQDERYHEAK